MKTASTQPEAKALGLSSYFTGRPCKHGHVAKRYTTNKACASCAVTGLARWRNGPGRESWRAYRRRYKYGLTDEAYTAILLAQGGGCAICGGQSRSKKKGTLCVDHDHKTGLVRGLLCDVCNQAIGLFCDSPERMRKASSYLEAASELSS